MEIIQAVDPNDIGFGVYVIKSAWGANDLTTIFKDLLVAIKSNGGIVLLAKDGEKTVGVSFGFVGRRNGKTYLYSHMTGVIPNYRNNEVGYKLKIKQREWALGHGFDMISWTFDPLQGLNSNFNLRKLGAIARVYERNHYGDMRDSINAGLPSDRVIAEWFIKSRHVIDRLENRFNTYGELPKATSTEVKDGEVFIVDVDLSLMNEQIMVEIPLDLGKLKEKNIEEAIRWREMTAKVYEHYFSRGYALIDFVRINGRNFQVLSRNLPDDIDRKSIFA